MTPAQARLALTARIAALVPDASYQQGAEVWTESKVPLIPELTPEPAAQLSFFVDSRNLTLTSTRQNASEDLFFSPVWTVRFLYRMRASDRVGDWDKASAATVALWKWLLSWEGPPQLVPENDFATNRVLGDWIAVEMRFRVFFPSSSV